MEFTNLWMVHDDPNLLDDDGEVSKSEGSV